LNIQSTEIIKIIYKELRPLGFAKRTLIMGLKLIYLYKNEQRKEGLKLRNKKKRELVLINANRIDENKGA
jgi:hypothetical protein